MESVKRIAASVILVCAGLSALATGNDAKDRSGVVLGTPFADGMVLQRGMDVPVWGWTEPGARVTVTFADHSVTGTAGADGAWQVTLPKMEASKVGRTMTISSHPSPSHLSPLTLTNILVGEVWFVSGQSNAECPVWGGDYPHFRDRNGGLTVAMARRPNIRFCYYSDYKWSAEPKRRGERTAQWLEMNAENLGRDFRGNGEGFTAIGTYFALELNSSLDVPVGIVGAYWGATRIEPWIPACAYDRPVPILDAQTFKAKGGITNVLPYVRNPNSWQNSPHQQPSALWNEMVEPWAPMAMRGFLWYQGCSNAGQPDHYCKLMHRLYDGWAKRFGNSALELLFVQLAPYEGLDFGELREAQNAFEKEEPHAAMAVINDVSDITDIHPNDKLAVGKRLAALALSRSYGFPFDGHSPTLKSAKVENGRFILDFDHVKNFYYRGASYLDTASGFEVAGADGTWKEAVIENMIVEPRWDKKLMVRKPIGGSRLVVSSKEVANPVKLRYLYRRPWFGAIRNELGLPLGQFRTAIR